MIPFWVILARGLPGNHLKEAPAPHLRKEGGGGESEGKKRRKSILEMWQNLSDQNQTQQGRHLGNVRGRGRARKAKKERNEEIDTPRKRPEKEKE